MSKIMKQKYEQKNESEDKLKKILELINTCLVVVKQSKSEQENNQKFEIVFKSEDIQTLINQN